MPELQLQVSNKELDEIRSRAKTAGLTIEDYMRDLLGLPDEESSAEMRSSEDWEAIKRRFEAMRNWGQS